MPGLGYGMGVADRIFGELELDPSEYFLAEWRSFYEGFVLHG